MILPDGVREIAGFELLGIPVGRFVLAFLVIVVSLALRKLILSIVERRMARRQGRAGEPGEAAEGADEDTAAERRRRALEYLSSGVRRASRPLGLAVVILGIYFALEVLSLPSGITLWTGRLFLALIVFDVMWFLFGLVDGAAEATGAIAEKTESQLDDQLIPLLRKVAKIVVSALAIVFLLQAMGYPVGGLLAGLGIGGIALALAAQDTVAGVFASVAIFLDRPFMVGDFISVGGLIGTVEEIGIRSTRLRTVEKTLVSIPNKILMDERIDNWSMRPMRRVSLTLGVTYETNADQMEKLLEDIRSCLAANTDVDDEMILVNFTEFGDSSLDVQCIFFLRTVDYAEWLRMRERINLDLMRVVADDGLSIAFPSTSVYIEKD